MKKLLREYELNSDMQYFQMCLESLINGQREQAKQQFLALPKINRKSFVGALLWHWGNISTDTQRFFFNLM